MSATPTSMWISDKIFGILHRPCQSAKVIRRSISFKIFRKALHLSDLKVMPWCKDSLCFRMRSERIKIRKGSVCRLKFIVLVNDVSFENYWDFINGADISQHNWVIMQKKKTRCRHLSIIFHNVLWIEVSNRESDKSIFWSKEQNDNFGNAWETDELQSVIFTHTCRWRGRILLTGIEWQVDKERTLSSLDVCGLSNMVKYEQVLPYYLALALLFGKLLIFSYVPPCWHFPVKMFW